MATNTRRSNPSSSSSSNNRHIVTRKFGDNSGDGGEEKSTDERMNATNHSAVSPDSGDQLEVESVPSSSRRSSAGMLYEWSSQWTSQVGQALSSSSKYQTNGTDGERDVPATASNAPRRTSVTALYEFAAQLASSASRKSLSSEGDGSRGEDLAAQLNGQSAGDGGGNASRRSSVGTLTDFVAQLTASSHGVARKSSNSGVRELAAQLAAQITGAGSGNQPSRKSWFFRGNNNSVRSSASSSAKNTPVQSVRSGRSGRLKQSFNAGRSLVMKSFFVKGGGGQVAVTANEASQKAGKTRFTEAEQDVLRLLQSPIALAYFRGFCVEQRAAEYVDFYLDVEKFRTQVAHNAPRMTAQSAKGEVPLRWVAIDEKVFGTAKDDLVVNAQMFVSAWDETPVGDGAVARVMPVHPAAARICRLYLDETAFAQRPAMPQPVVAAAPVAALAAAVAAVAVETSGGAPVADEKKLEEDGGGGGGMWMGTRRDMLADCAPVAVAAAGDLKRDASCLDSTSTPICLSKRVAGNTRLRLGHEDAYGCEVFSEAALEVLRYLAKDVYPRFVRSTWHARMAQRGKLAFELKKKALLPRPSALRVRAPESKILNDYINRKSNGPGSETRLFEAADVVHDGILYNEFLQRLRTTSSTEFLLCLRAINIFKDLVEGKQHDGCSTVASKAASRQSSGHNSREASEAPQQSYRRASTSSTRAPQRFSFNVEQTKRKLEVLRTGLPPPEPLCSPQAEEQAWTIYLFFVARGAAYEISISQASVDEILASLARPRVDMFKALETAAKVELEAHFDNYRRNNKASYESWASRALAVAESIKKIEDQGGALGRWRRFWKGVWRSMTDTKNRKK